MGELVRVVFRQLELVELRIPGIFMTRLILGYGNPLRSDDGFGWKAAGAIEPKVSAADVSVVAVQQLTPELAEVVARSSRILFLDAGHDGQPGEIRMGLVRRDVDLQPGAISHHLSPSALLGIAYYYFRSEPQATLLTVTGGNFDVGEDFSPAVQNAWKPCLERVLEWVRAL